MRSSHVIFQSNLLAVHHWHLIWIPRNYQLRHRFQSGCSILQRCNLADKIGGCEAAAKRASSQRSETCAVWSWFLVSSSRGSGRHLGFRSVQGWREQITNNSNQREHQASYKIVLAALEVAKSAATNIRRSHWLPGTAVSIWAPRMRTAKVAWSDCGGLQRPRGIMHSANWKQQTKWPRLEVSGHYGHQKSSKNAKWSALENM